MTPQQYDGYASRLERLGKQIERWRGTRLKKSPMPGELWEEAAALARELGVNPVRSALRLSYESLRLRVARAPAESAVEQAGFVHLVQSQGTQPVSGAVVEVSDTTGARLRVELPAGSPLDMAGLIAAFRGARS